MKCVLLGPVYPFRGGIAHYTTLLWRHIQQRHDALLISFSRQYPQWLFPGRTDLDPSEDYLHVECERIIDPFNPWTWIQAARRIRDWAPDLLLIQWWVPFWAPVWLSILWLVRRRIAPQVLMISHNVIPHEPRRIDYALARWVLGQGDAIIVHSERDRDDLLRLLPEARISVTAHPTYEVFAKGPPSRSQACHVLGLDEKRLILLFFGFVRAYKGLGYLIEALPQVMAHLDAHLLVAGEFWDDPTRYRDRIRSLGQEDRVTFVDRYIPNEEVPTFFAAANLAVLPYVDATQSGVIQLAFGFGLPVITTTVGGLAETVEHGSTGFLVPPGDVQALAQAIVDYFAQGWEPVFRSNVQAQRDRFSWERLVTLIEGLSRA